MSQEEIDALFASLSGSSPKVDPKQKPGTDGSAKPPTLPTAPARVAPPTPAVTGSVKPPTVRATTPPAALTGVQAATAAVPAPAAKAATPKGALSQDDVDALLASMGGDGQQSKAAQAAANKADRLGPPTPMPASPTGPLSQDDIDALLNSMGAAEPAPAPAPAPAATGPLSQDDIDALLNSMGAAESAAAPAPAAALTGPLSQDDIDALLNSMGVDDGAAAATAAPVPTDRALTQDEIDALVASTAGSDTVENAPVATGAIASADTEADDDAGHGVATSTGIGLDTLENLLEKHAGAFAKSETEAVISQEDIDALVRQMGQSPGASPATGENAPHTSAFETDMASLLSQAQAEVQATDPLILSQRSTPAPMLVPVGAMAPEELRGTRMMLAAAVLLLAMCTVTMAFVVSSMNGLKAELRRGNDATLAPGDDTVRDIEVARTLLASSDDAERTKGELFIDRLRSRHPDRELELTLLLAEHHRRRNALARAVREYANAAAVQPALADDPTLYLSWARCHETLGAWGEARRVIMTMLANEDRYLALASGGFQRDRQELDRNRRTLREGFLLLGRVDGALVAGGRGAAASTDGYGPSPAAHGAAAHDNGHGDSHGNGGHAPASPAAPSHGAGDAKHGNDHGGGHGTAPAPAPAHDGHARGQHAATGSHG
jgi:flagellar motor switch protein FliM